MAARFLGAIRRARLAFRAQVAAKGLWKLIAEEALFVAFMALLVILIWRTLILLAGRLTP